MVHIREIYSLICNACSHGKPWLLWYLLKTQLTFLAHFVILKLHIWESSLTVRLLTPHMKTRKYGGEDGTEKFTRKILKLFENYK